MYSLTAQKIEFLFQNLQTTTFHPFLSYQLMMLSHLFLHTTFHTFFIKLLAHLVLFFILQKHFDLILQKIFLDLLSKFALNQNF
jgi:hypothetical protein